MASGKPSMMRQWADIKRSTPGCIVLFRLGDFYEAFNEDAGLLAEICDVTLTSRPVKKGQRVPMAGVPYHAVDGYIAQLVKAGQKVALVEQRGGESSPEKRARMSRPLVQAESDAPAEGAEPQQPGLPMPGAPTTKSKPKILAREVVRVVTPGTLVENHLIAADSNNYLVALHGAFDDREGVGDRSDVGEGGGTATDAPIGLAQLDISTGEFLTTEWRSGRDGRRVLDELLRLRPAELLVPEPESPAERAGLERLRERLERLELGTLVVPQPSWRFEAENARRVLLEHFHTQSLAPFGCADMPWATGAAAAALAYAREAQRGPLAQVTRLATWSGVGHMALDAMTRRNLELTATLRGGHKRGTLLWVVDATRTAMGGRRLRQWVERPLLDLEQINRRLDAVEALVAEPILRAELRQQLGAVPDIERLVNRIVSGYAGPRELVKLAAGLRAVEGLAHRLRDEQEGLPAPLAELCRQDVAAAAEHIELTLSDEPPATLGVSGVIRRGRSPELDAVHDGVTEARDWIAALEGRERERTGIQRLKVGYNKVFGYYLQVPKSQATRVPEEYERKQTLVDGERYITPALKSREVEVQSAEERILEIERGLYRALIADVAGEAQTLLAAARDVGALDAMAGLAETAANEDWTRPVLDDSRALEIEGGRHPVVERVQRDTPFVPNDLCLADGEIALLTGPNMAGKSTVARQAALIVLLAQVGSFVPARRARIGLVDRVFARIGAQDEIAEGRSTFMVEMVETALILHHATPRSLVILDELGRGTSTYDGIAIAWAVLEALHEDAQLGCRTLFATHYHELTALSERLGRLRNLHMAVTESEGGVVFLHRVAPGAADRSYGVHVAELAGLPRAVTDRAWEILRQLEAQDADPVEVAAPSEAPSRGVIGDSALRPAEREVVAALRGVDIDALTPLEALNRLAALHAKLDEES